MGVCEVRFVVDVVVLSASRGVHNLDEFRGTFGEVFDPGYALALGFYDVSVDSATFYACEVLLSRTT